MVKIQASETKTNFINVFIRRGPMRFKPLMLLLVSMEEFLEFRGILNFITNFCTTVVGHVGHVWCLQKNPLIFGGTVEEN
jgi:hypothetical protein